LRVLLVIARPAGQQDVGYRMIARHLLERLDAVRGEVDLQVLRPPTFRTFQEAVQQAAAAGQPYQVVHFDGHGVLAGRPRGGGLGLGRRDQFGADQAAGLLLFEGEGGGEDPVSAAAFAAVVRHGQVPVVVLNACQSGALGDQTEAAVATRLLQDGAASVVAMGYSVYVVAAAEFMAAFYEALFAGRSVGEAVAAGRQQLYHRQERPSPKGPMALQDWMVPVHYARSDIRFPDLQPQPSARPTGLSLDQALDQLRQHPAHGGEPARDLLAPVGRFVGRDDLVYQLELACRLQRVVLIHGSGGTGKTELAKAFGRWWQDTGGVDVPDGVSFQSFEPGVATFGLDGVIAAVGLQLFGPDPKFARLATTERRQVVLQTLRKHRLLLIWDNFESVASMPDPAQATPPLDEAGRTELRDFLAELARPGSRSTVLITSRTEEVWLGELRRIELGGLRAEEAAEYADDLLAPYPRARARREGRAFAELLEWLDGHPLALRIMLPQLEHPTRAGAGRPERPNPSASRVPGRRRPHRLPWRERPVLPRPSRRGHPQAAARSRAVRRRRRPQCPDTRLPRRGRAGVASGGQPRPMDGGAGCGRRGGAAHPTWRTNVLDASGPARLPNRRLAQPGAGRLPGRGGRCPAGPHRRLRHPWHMAPSANQAG